MKIYKFKKYEKILPNLYNNEFKIIRKIIPSSLPIQHIGSTAVPGLHGKGIVDIMIYSPNNKVKAVKNNLETIGYTEGSSEKGRIFLRRDTKINGKKRRFHVHIISIKQLWDDKVNFRDYLIKNQEISNEYAKLKKQAVIDSNNEGKIYRKIKDKFIKKHTKIANKLFNECT